MKNEDWVQVLEAFNIEKNKWVSLSEINRILLKDGRGIYPNYLYLKFLVTDKNEILIQHGSPIRFGSQLPSPSSVNHEKKNFTFDPNLLSSNFRKPVQGDILVACSRNGSYIQAYIDNAINSFNGLFIQTVTALRSEYGTIFSFYNPLQVKDNSYFNFKTGEFFNFLPNEKGKKSPFGIYQEKIKISDIENITLK